MQLENLAIILENILEQKISINSINKSSKFAIAIYRRQAKAYNPKIGSNIGYKILSTSLILRLKDNAIWAENKANEIYKKIENINNENLISIMLYDAPIWLGTDKLGIHEYSVDIDFIGGN